MDLPRSARPGAPAVGILSSFLDDPYSIQIARAAAQRLTREGFNSITFTSGFPRAPMFSGASGIPSIPPVLRGLIVLSSTLREFNQELVHLSEYTQAPVVSIGTELPRASNIVTDDEAGMFQVIAHLVKQHGCRRIAFIGAPEGSADGARRFTAYRAVLESFHLNWDPALVTRGDYEASSGREAVLELRRYRTFDAIVAANDLMAIGAMEGLQAAGLRVPEDVRIAGFDDLEEAAFTSPSLTTVRQPTSEQGISAAELVMRALGNEPPEPETLSISAPLVIRKSCGCGLSEPPRRAMQTVEPPDRGFVDDALRGVIRRQMAARRLQRELSRLAEQVIDAPGLPELAAAMTGVFRLLNPRRLLLCRYQGGMSHARVVLESVDRDVVFRSDSRPFALGGLVPDGFLKPAQPAHLWIETLQLANEHVGYVVLETEAGDYQPLLEIRHALSSALGRIELISELRRLYAGERKAGEAPR